MNKLYLFALAKQLVEASPYTTKTFTKARRAVYLQKLSTQLFVAWLSMVLIYTVGTIIFKREHFVPLQSGVFNVSLCGFIIFKVFVKLRINTLFECNKLWTEIERTDNPKDLGYLLDVIDVATTQERPSLWSEQRVPDAIHNTIKRLLHRIDVENISLLNNRQRTQLYKLVLPTFDINMERRYDPQLALVLLTVLERMRVHEALPYVRRLAKRSDMQLVLRATAQQCLTCLEESLAQQQTEQTLLRPSAASTPPDMLLRPANDTKQSASEAAEQLLRSTASLEAVPASNGNTALLPNCERTASQEQSPVQKIQTGP